MLTLKRRHVFGADAGFGRILASNETIMYRLLPVAAGKTGCRFHNRLAVSLRFAQQHRQRFDN